MKKITLLTLAIMFAVGTLFAQNSDKKWGIGVGAGMDKNSETEEKNSLIEFYVNRYLSPSFDIMLDYRQTFYGDQWFNGDDGDGQTFFGDGTDIVNPLINVTYKFSNGKIIKEDSKIQPFLIAGLGYLWDNDASGVNFDAGAGVKVPITPNIKLSLTGTYVSGIEGDRLVVPHTPNQDMETVTDNHFQLAGVIEFAVGKAKDTDGDGVPDRKDECPDTPPGVQVDEKGCPLDRDGDGVPDYKDDCPDEAGLAEHNGCPDRDGDGIPDKDDECPDVPGLAKFNGCPDTDEDGVPDPKDKCPDTPKGCPVDADGCPLDSDGDGVIDCEDKCPQVAGPASNNGCPDWQDLTIPAIYFDLNKAVLSDEGKAELDKLADQLIASKEFELVVSGNTCNVGTEEYNMGLSEKRAQAVVKYLLSKGVNNASVGSNNYGETKPAVENSSRANRKLNRRAEFEVAKVRK